MERYAHVTAAQQRTPPTSSTSRWRAQPLTVTHDSHGSVDGVVEGGPEQPEVGHSFEESGSGGRTRTYDQAVNSRPLYH